jgi:Xanthine and CO dehydrogenases maturation factor, XdhC/CoxF family
MKTRDLYRELATLAEQGTPFVLATIIESTGSTPRKTGAKMVVLADGRTIDTVGGGKIEAQVIRDALDALKRGVSGIVEYVLRPSGEHALGMVCGGEAKVFLEVHVPDRTLVIAGAGHISQKLCPMAKLLDFRVTVIDQRSEFANAERFPLADEVIVGPPADIASLVRLDDRTHVVIVTHGHLFDMDALRAVATSPVAYVGMIGSRTKVRTVMRDLEAEGVPAEALARVHAPIGIDLGGQTPGEIAVSILAQIIAGWHDRQVAAVSGASAETAVEADAGAVQCTPAAKDS